METSIAVLGCGYWGSNHIKTLSQLGKLSAVSDIDLAKAQSIANNYNVPALSPQALFVDSSISAVVLALPPQFHAQNAMQAIKNGKDVLIEKPISLEVEIAQQTVDLAQSANRVLMVGHILRFHPAFERLLELVIDGTIGSLNYIATTRLGFGKFHNNSDALWDLAPHDLSMILALAGAAPTGLQASQQVIVGSGADFANLALEFPDNLVASLSVSRLSPYRERRLTVVGSKAIAVFDDLESWDKKLAIYEYNIERTGLCWPAACSEPNYIALTESMPLKNELQHFIDCIETRQTPRTDGAEAIEILRILQQIAPRSVQDRT